METSKSQEAVDRIERTDPSKGNGPRETTVAVASVAAEAAEREAEASAEDAQPPPPANRDAPLRPHAARSRGHEQGQDARRPRGAVRGDERRPRGPLGRQRGPLGASPSDDVVREVVLMPYNTAG